MIVLYLFIGVLNSLWGYEALVSAVNSKSSELKIIHEGNTISELNKAIDKTLFSIEMKSYINLRDKNGAKVDNIIAQRKIVDLILTTIKDVLDVVSLHQMKKKIINKKFVREIVVKSFQISDKALKQFGIKLTNDSHQKIVDILVSVILTTIENGGKFGGNIDVSPTLYLGLVLDGISISNDIDATIELNNFLFYNQVDDIANAFIHKYLDSVFNKHSAINLEYFLNNYYYYNGKYYDSESFIQKAKYPPSFGDRIISHIKTENDILESYDCNSTLDCMTQYSNNLVAAPIDILTSTYEDFIGIDNFKKRLQERIDIRLAQLGIHQNLLFHMSIDDNFVTDSTRGKTLTTKYIHKISDLSSVKIYAITNKNQELYIYPYCGTTDNNFEHKILVQYSHKANEQVFYKEKECKTYDSSEDGSYNGLAVSLNKKLYNLIDYFHLQKRYLNIKEGFFYRSFYNQIRSLKIHGIKLNDSRTFSGNYAISSKQANLIIFTLNNYLVRQAGKYLGGEHLKSLIFPKSEKITYAKLFFRLDVLLKHFYGKDYFKLEDQILYPYFNSSLYLKKRIKKIRKEALMENSSDYFKYLQHLSQAGIIRLELKYVAKKLHQPIEVKDFIKYVNRTLEF